MFVANAPAPMMSVTLFWADPLGASTNDMAASGDHDRNFYLWGAMGGAVMIGLGIALAQPKLPVVVITELEGKRHHPELGWFARTALRQLDGLRILHGRLDAPGRERPARIVAVVLEEVLHEVQGPRLEGLPGGLRGDDGHHGARPLLKCTDLGSLRYALNVLFFYALRSSKVP